MSASSNGWEKKLRGHSRRARTTLISAAISRDLAAEIQPGEQAEHECEHALEVSWV